MFESRREVSYKIDFNTLLNFLLNYQWSNLVDGNLLIEEQYKWIVQLDQQSKNNQIIEMKYDENSSTIRIKITPEHSKHFSYDLISICLIKEELSTRVNMSYKYHPNSLVEKLFAIILNRENDIFNVYAAMLFDDISKFMLEKIYG